jgi:hypothetical protein
MVKTRYLQSSHQIKWRSLEDVYFKSKYSGKHLFVQQSAIISPNEISFDNFLHPFYNYTRKTESLIY